MKSPTQRGTPVFRREKEVISIISFLEERLVPSAGRWCIGTISLVIFFILSSPICAFANLLGDPGFELRNGSWNASSAGTNGWWNLLNSGEAHSGSRFQYLGRAINYSTTANNVDGVLYQDVFIPTGSASANLTFWLKITSSEIGSTAYDKLRIEIRNTSNTVLQTLKTYSNADATGAWSKPAALSINGYAGQTIRIAFHGTTDEAVETVFRIDDVDLEAVIPPGTPDLRKSSDSLTNLSPRPGDTVTASITVKNYPATGAGTDVGTFHVGFYWSSSSNFNGLSPFAEKSVSGIAANGTATIDQNITINVSTTPGTYYLGYKIDSRSVISEADEGNNLWYWTVNVLPAPLPNLTKNTDSLSNLSPKSGSTVSAQINIRNQLTGGTGSAAGPFHVGFYWSSSTNFNGISPFVERSINGIAADGTATIDQNITINVSTTPGTYYLGYRIDNRDEVAEANENDNFLYWTVTVMPGTPSPELVSVTGIPASIQLGQSFTVTVTAKNNFGVGGQFSAINASVVYNDGTDQLSITNPSAPWASNPIHNYAPGTIIYTNTCTAFASSDHLVEAVDNNWLPEEQHVMSFSVTPEKAGTLFVRARVTLQDGDTGCEYENNASAPGGTFATDQQGWVVSQFSVDVKAPLPNLAHYQPVGWSDRMVLSTTPGTHISAPSVTTTDNVYLDLAFFNQGQVITGPFHAQVKIDGVVASTMSFQSLAPSGTLQILDEPLGKLSAGIHVVSLHLDSSDEVTESVESVDNYYEVPITVTGPTGPQVRITAPSGSSTWHVGETIPITWTLGGGTAGVTGIRVSFLMNGVVFYSSTKSASTRSLNWTVPSGFITSAGAIRVEALGPVGDFDQVAILTSSAQSSTLYPIIIMSHASPVPLNSVVQFSAANSLGSISKYSWRFSDGTVLDDAPSVVTHVFKTAQTGKGWVELFLNGFGSPYKASVAFALSGSATDPNTGQSKDPVGTATGNFFLGLDLMPVRARGLNFLFQAYYSSMSYRPAADELSASSPGALGYGWTHTFEARIDTAIEDDARVALVSFGDGHAEKYRMNPALIATEQWQPQTGTYNRLREESDGKFTLRTNSDIVHEFDSTGRLGAIADRNGNRLNVIWESIPGASPDDKRIQKIVLPGGPADGSEVHEVAFHYRPETPAFLWKLEDPMHRFIIFNQDANGDLISYTNERNAMTSYAYDQLHQLIRGTDAESNQFVRNYYNSDRRVERQEDASGNVTLFEYNFPPPDSPDNRSTKIVRLASTAFQSTDPRNEMTEDIHDPKLRLLERRLKVEDQDHPENYVILTQRWSYDPITGDMVSSVNRRGYETKYTYVAGNVTEVKTPDGGVTTYQYEDTRNPKLPTLITYPDPQVKRRLEYDEKGNLLFSTFPYDPDLPMENRRTTLRDDYGQVISTTDANKVTQTFDFDHWGRMWRRVDGELNIHRFEFDASGRTVAEIDPSGNRTDFIRNETGDIIRTSRPDPEDADRPIVSETAYNANGQPVRSIDPLSHVFHSYRDEQGRVWKEEDHAGHTTIHRFDPFGREIETENAKGGKTVRTYNLAGYLLNVASPAPSSNVIRYRRDANGNPTETKDGDGVRITAEFDSMDRQITTRRWKSATEWEESRTSYNIMNQREWDEDEGDENGVRGRTSYYYDLAGNHVRTAPVVGPEFIFEFDSEGHQTAVTHDGNRTRRDTYTRNYELKTRVDEIGNSEVFGYDNAGNLKSKTTRGDGVEQTTSYDYDSLHRLIRINPPNGPPVTFKYDRASRRTEMADLTGVTRWAFSALNQVESIEAPGGLSLSFHYDPLGGTDSITYPGNRTITYKIDEAGRFESVKDWENRTISQTYTEGDRPLRLQFPNGIYTRFGQDSEGRADSIIHQKGSEPALLQLKYRFDARGRLAESPDFPVSDTVVDYPRTYGSANELLTVASSPVVHDFRGNITSAKLSPTAPEIDTLSWDHANHLTSGTVGGVPFLNVFNGLGNRVSATQNGGNRGFLNDDRSFMPRIMAETEATGNPTAFYIYAGNWLLARILTDGTISYYHTDRQGNVVLLTDSNGSIAARYEYDPFGVLASSSGPLAPSNQFRYLGGLGVWDNLNGTLHARSRTYHPLLGRFLSRDALYGRSENGQSLNRYVYALNDPFNFADPSGFSPVRPLVYSAPPQFSFWKTFGKELTTRLGYVGAGFIPGVGEAMDLQVLADPNASAVAKSLAAASLAASAESGGVLPNFGGLRRAVSTETNYVYRAVRREELDTIESGQGILRGSGGTTATQHVLGVKHAENPWVSTTNSLESAQFFSTHGGMLPAGPIIRIDLGKVTNQIFDVSNPTAASAILNHPRAVNFSAAHGEILIKGGVNPEAISIFSP